MQLIDGIKPPRKISRQQAIERIMQLEDMMHKLVADMDISGMSAAGDALDKLIDGPLGAVYTAVCEGN